MRTRYDELMERLRDSARPDREAPPELAAYVEKVRRHAYETTDRDIAELKEAGFSEDEIFEHTVSAAAAAGFERLATALEVLE